MTQPSFIHLRVHSDYSMFDGLPKVKKLVHQAVNHGMPALAMTDQMNLCGLVKFYQNCNASGVKPIVGSDIWLADDQDAGVVYRLTLLAMNNQGYQNLTLLISLAYQRGYRLGYPTVNREDLQKYAADLIVLSGGLEGELGQALLSGQAQKLNMALDFYTTYFANRFYIEVLRTGRPQEETYLHLAVQCAENYDLPLVATNEVVFLEAKDFDAHEIRVAIHDGYTLADPKRPQRYSEQQFFRSAQDMQELFQDLPTALDNTVEIAKRCNVTLKLDEYFLPNFPTGGLSEEDYLVKVSKEGLEQRLCTLFPDPVQRETERTQYDERLMIELNVINQMGFPGYFLIVMEFIQWAKEQDIPVGPGRGSGAGSLVAYALSITDLDPIALDLLFERFLNPERVSMPDFDIDFCMDRRDEVIEHTAEIYGRDAVSQIITFGTMAAKAVIRDVGRVLGHSYGFVDRIAKMIPPDPGMTLEKAFEIEPSLQESYDGDEEVKELIDIARTLEGVTRNAGKHAGGVVIAPTQITDFSPIYCDDEGLHPVTQFDKNDVETAGLVKFDFLGLRTLTIIDWALKLINQDRVAHNESVLAIEQIPLDDKAAFDLLKRAQTTAVFQLESRGMKDLIKRLQPDCLEDIIALVALFRPGPLQSGMVDNFIDRKHGREPISYPDATYQHACLQPILEPTYGIILYQEQVMQIAQELAGYTLGGADLLRRAMGKKKPEEMAKQRDIFKEGALANQVDGELAMRIFDLVEKFAGYGFNKSHSAAYALVSYQTLWLKTHYPSYFMAAVMSADMDNTDKIVILVEELAQLGLSICSPHVNSSDYHFSVDAQNRIVYGLGAVKGVGAAVVENIVKVRQAGPFQDLFDFCARIDLKKANKRVLEKLILAGALDDLGAHRGMLMHNLPQAMAAAAQHAQAQAQGQTDLFGLLNDQESSVSRQAYAKCLPWSQKKVLQGEKETLGLYLTGHPIDEYEAELAHITHGSLSQLQNMMRKKVLRVAGLVTGLRTVMTKKGNKMAIVTITDRSGRLDVVIFSDLYDSSKDILQKDEVLIVEGEVGFDDFSQQYKLTARQVQSLFQARSAHAIALELDLLTEKVDNNTLKSLKNLLSPPKTGQVPLNICCVHQGMRCQLKLGEAWSVDLHDEWIEELEAFWGKGQVRIVYSTE